MENTGKRNSEELRIQGLLDRYLNRQSAANNLSTQENHLDEDSLTAFVEGNLSEREAKPMVSHLVDCSFCRHVTAELVRLDFAFADEQVNTVVAAESQPSKISEVLNNLLARIFGTGDSAVFAHHETEEKTETSETKEEKDAEK